jgi:hypothetical protein
VRRSVSKPVQRHPSSIDGPRKLTRSVRWFLHEADGEHRSCPARPQNESNINPDGQLNGTPLSTLTPLSDSTRMCPYPQHLMRHPPQYDELSRGRDCRCNGESLGAVNASSKKIEYQRKDNGDNSYTQQEVLL